MVAAKRLVGVALKWNRRKPSYRGVNHFYHPQTKFAKVMLSQVFVCPQSCLSAGVGSLSGRFPPYGYVRAVRILLECILVLDIFCSGYFVWYLYLN